MSDWDNSESEEDTQTKPEQKQQTKQTTQANNDWNISDSSDDEQAKQAPITNQIHNQNNADKSAENDNKQVKQPQQKENEQEKIKKMQKKMQNYKKKQKRKNKRKNKNKNKKQAIAIPTNQDEIIAMSSSDASVDESTKKPMQSYEERMKTDNDILFEGHTSKKQEKQAKDDTRVMLSGEVSLKNFPLGSRRDCENLATQISALLDQKLFENDINANDVFLFYKKLLASSIVHKLDMVDTKELTNKMNSLLAAKQKAWHKAKNPKNKKKKKAQWIAGKDKQIKKNSHRDGAYDSDEFSLFD